jgi:hypothetical protein
VRRRATFAECVFANGATAALNFDFGKVSGIAQGRFNIFVDVADCHSRAPTQLQATTRRFQYFQFDWKYSGTLLNYRALIVMSLPVSSIAGPAYQRS